MGIFNKIKLRHKILAFLTIFAVSLVSILTFIDSYSLREEKRKEYLSRLEVARENFLAHVEEEVSRIRQITLNRASQRSFLEASVSRDTARLSQMMQNALARLNLDAMAEVDSEQQYVSVAARDSGIEVAFAEAVHRMNDDATEGGTPA